MNLNYNLIIITGVQKIDYYLLIKQINGKIRRLKKAPREHLLDIKYYFNIKHMFLFIKKSNRKKDFDKFCMTYS